MKLLSRHIAPLVRSAVVLATCMGTCIVPASAQTAVSSQFHAPQTPAQENASKGAAFLADNATKPGVVTTASGLQYLVVKLGTGPKPRRTDTVKVNYVGTLLDGTAVDSSAKNGGPVSFGVGDVIAGWTEGLQLMPVGSKFTFWIPSNLAYGKSGTQGGPVGPNATLKFDVELLSRSAN